MTDQQARKTKITNVYDRQAEKRRSPTNITKVTNQAKITIKQATDTKIRNVKANKGRDPHKYNEFDEDIITKRK